LFLSVSPRSLAVTDVRAVDDHIIFKAVISTAAVMTPTASKGKQNKLPEMLGRITPFPTPSAIEIDGGISGAIGVGTH
jgi:hypothetical protein